MAATMLTASAFAHTAKEANGLTRFHPGRSATPAKPIVDPPIPLALAHGSALIQYRAENVRISPVFGPAALNVFPRVGHLHINVDGLPWHWADASNPGTIDIKACRPTKSQSIWSTPTTSSFPGSPSRYPSPCPKHLKPIEKEMP